MPYISILLALPAIEASSTKPPRARPPDIKKVGNPTGRADPEQKNESLSYQ
jgi:hypothetical protein